MFRALFRALLPEHRNDLWSCWVQPSDCAVPSCRLIAEYIEAAPTSAVEDAVQTLSGVNLLRMAHTREGAGAACAVLAYGTAKDRKQAVKAMQGASARRFCGTWQRRQSQRR